MTTSLTKIPSVDYIEPPLCACGCGEKVRTLSRTGTWARYTRGHQLAMPRSKVPCSCGCGQLVTTPDKKGRDRQFVDGHGWRIRNSAYLSGNSFAKLDRWAKDYERCRVCGRTDYRHYSRGVCSPCASTLNKRVRAFVEGHPCAICGETRVMEAAHLVKSDEAYSKPEPVFIAAMCPTHHALFDKELLTAAELGKIKELLDKAAIREQEVIRGR